MAKKATGKYDGQPKYCGGCAATHTDFYDNGRCKLCRAKANAKRTSDSRAESYNRNRAPFKGDKFILEAAKRGRITESEVHDFIGSQEDFDRWEVQKATLKTINGDTGAAVYTGDHLVPVGVLHRDSFGNWWTGTNRPENIIITTIEANRAKAGKLAPECYLKPPFAMKRDEGAFNNRKQRGIGILRNELSGAVGFDLSGRQVKTLAAGKIDLSNWEMLKPDDFIFEDDRRWYAAMPPAEQKQYCKDIWAEECQRLKLENDVFEMKPKEKKPPLSNAEFWDWLLENHASQVPYKVRRKVRKLVADVGLIERLEQGQKLPEAYKLEGEIRKGEALRCKRLLERYCTLIQTGERFDWIELGWEIVPSDSEMEHRSRMQEDSYLCPLWVQWVTTDIDLNQQIPPESIRINGRLFNCEMDVGQLLFDVLLPLYKWDKSRAKSTWDEVRELLRTSERWEYGAFIDLKIPQYQQVLDYLDWCGQAMLSWEEVKEPVQRITKSVPPATRKPYPLGKVMQLPVRTRQNIYRLRVKKIKEGKL